MVRRLLIMVAAFALAACNLSVPQVTPTVAPSRTPSQTPPVSATPSVTPSRTASPTPNPTIIAQLVASDTPTSSPTVTVTPSTTATDTSTATDTATASDTPTPTETDTPTRTHTPQPSVTVTDTPTQTDTPTDTLTPTATDTDTPSPTFSPTASDTPTRTSTPSPTATDTPVPTVTPFPTLGPSDTPTATATATPTLTVTASITPTPTETLTPSDTPRPSPTHTRTLSPEELAILLGTIQPTFTPIPTGTATNTLTPPTLDVTPTFITATPFASQTAIIVTTTPLPALPTETPAPVPSLTPLPTLTGFPTLIPIDPGVRAFILGTQGGELLRGGVPLIEDAALFERNPQNPAQYAVTDSSGQLYFTGLNGENTSRVTESPFSEFIAFSREENNAYVSDIAWSPDGQYLAFLVNGDRLAVDGVWFFAPGQFPPIQLLVDCPTPEHPGCQIVTSPAGPDLWESLSLEWTANGGEALLVRTWMPSRNRAGLTVLPITRDEAVRNARPPVYEYEYGSWANDGSRILVSGSGPDGNVYIGWINRDGSFSELVFAARDAGLWVQHAVQRPDGSIVTLGAPFNEGGPGAPQRIYTADGIPLTGPIGSAPPERVEWSPDRSAVLVVAGGRIYLADLNGTVADITDEVGGAQAINWVSGGLPATDGPQGTGSAIIDPVGVRQEPGNPYPAGTRLQVLAEAGLLVRAQPSTSAEVVASVLPGQVVITLTGGPVRDGTIVWWEVQAPEGINGWIAGEIDGQPMIGP